MYTDRFNKCKTFICRKKSRLAVFTFLYKYTSIIVGIFYLSSILLCLVQKNYIDTAKMIIIPFATFVLGTLIRSCINAKRPYEAYDIVPIIKKDTIGQSFPSRHMLSVVIITMAIFNFNTTLGFISLIFTFCIAVARPLAGVHFIKDILAGAAFSIICWYIGIFLFSLFNL